jgi:uncharacterized protein (TIGR02246 family)
MVNNAMTVENEIQTLFDTYLRAWNARDFEGMAGLFTEPAVHVVPGGVVSFPDRAAVAANLKERFAELESNGFDHAEIAAVEVRQCNDATAMVDLRNIARLRADGSALEVIDAVYVCIKQDGNWRLSIAIGCWPNWKAD